MAPKAPGPQGCARMIFDPPWTFDRPGRNETYTDS